MEMLIVCPKDRGNTYQVCRYAAEQLGCSLGIIARGDALDLKEYETVLLASGIYGKKIHESLAHWITELPGDLKNRFYLFTTSLSPGDYQHARRQVQQLLEQRGLKLEEDHMNCFGKNFLFFRLCHPNDADRRNVLAWVKQISSTV